MKMFNLPHEPFKPMKAESLLKGSMAMILLEVYRIGADLLIQINVMETPYEPSFLFYFIKHYIKQFGTLTQDSTQEHEHS